MKKILGFVGRWIGPALVILGVGSFVAKLGAPAPFPDPTPFPVVALVPFCGAVVTLIAWWATRASDHRWNRRILIASAIVGILFCGWRYWDQARSYREVTVSFTSRETQLVGTLFLPNVAGRVPGIVMVQGSGTLRRSIYKLFGADHFARAGYAVLTYDKRGVGDSGGKYEGPCDLCPDNLNLLVSDASAALTYLSTRSEVRSDMVGYWGVSQAGWIVPKAAVMNGHAAFLLMISAPTTTVHQNMRYGRFTGHPLFISKGNLTPDEAEILAARANEQFASPDTDPAPDLRRLAIPGLWVLGDRDGMVPPGRTVEILRTLAQSGKPYEYSIIHGAGHGIVVGGKERRRYWRLVDEWLARVTGSR
jgi:uncharacterized protein